MATRWCRVCAQDATEGFRQLPEPHELPLRVDGSSTNQAEGHSSDCVLKLVAVYPDSARVNGALVMCEVMMPDGKTPHSSNKRATILDDALRHGSASSRNTFTRTAARSAS